MMYKKNHLSKDAFGDPVKYRNYLRDRAFAHRSYLNPWDRHLELAESEEAEAQFIDNHLGIARNEHAVGPIHGQQRHIQTMGEEETGSTQGGFPPTQGGVDFNRLMATINGATGAAGLAGSWLLDSPSIATYVGAIPMAKALRYNYLAEQGLKERDAANNEYGNGAAPRYDSSIGWTGLPTPIDGWWR